MPDRGTTEQPAIGERGNAKPLAIRGHRCASPIQATETEEQEESDKGQLETDVMR